jgi:aminomethyltransferase
MLVVNAGCKEKVIQYLSQHLAAGSFHPRDDKALLALQGPSSLCVLREIFHEDMAQMPFMTSKRVETFDGVECIVSRCGYTGEDGFEIALPATAAESLARRLLDIDGVKPAGLGARDSLRLEAGLCLYGHELNEATPAIAAGLGWTISPSRREGNKAGGFVGADEILYQLKNGTAKKRVGLLVQAKVPVREVAILRDGNDNEAGVVTSGTFSPSLEVPIAMGYVDTCFAAIGTRLGTEVRNKPVDLLVSRLPFVAHRYAR